MKGRDKEWLLGRTRTLQPAGCVPDAVEAMRNGACDYGKIGEWIEKLGFASENEVTKALALQWGCAVATSFDPSASFFASEIPLPILEAFQMLPLNYVASSHTLYLAFGERVDHGPRPPLSCSTTCIRQSSAMSVGEAVVVVELYERRARAAACARSTWPWRMAS